MNIFDRALCRTFQLGMRRALPLLPYRDPQILDSVEQLPKVLRASGVERLLLVTDRQIRSRGLTAPLEKLLEREGLAVTVYEDTASNPTADNVEAERFLAAVRAMNYRMNIPRTLPEVRREDIPELARNAGREANPLYPVPVLWDAGQLEMFYYKVMEGGELLDPNRDPEHRQRPAGALPQRRHAAHGGAH